MNLYLQHNENATATEPIFYLKSIEDVNGVEDQTLLIGSAGAFETDIPHKRIDYIFPFQPQKIIKSSTVNINLSSSITGNVEIDPTLILKIPVLDATGQTVYEERDLAKGTLVKQSSGGAGNFDFRWTFTLNESYALAENNIILRLDITSIDNAQFTATAIDNVFTSVGIPFTSTQRLRLSNFDSALRINGLVPSSNTDYYIVEQVGDTFKLSTSIGGVAIDVTADGSGTLTSYSFVTLLQTESKVVADIVEGEKQNINIFTESKFKIFQKKEIMFLYSQVKALEDVMYLDSETEQRVRNKEIPRPKNSIFTTVESKEYINIDLYSHINAMEEIANIYSIEGTIKGPFTEVNPYVTDIELGEYSLPTWNLVVSPEIQNEQFKLRKREYLNNIVERLNNLPPILHPPTIPNYPDRNDIYKSVANKFIESVEMVKASDKSTKNSGSIETPESTRDYFVMPGGSFKVFVPGINLTSPGFIVNNKEIQLVFGYENTPYTLSTSINPIKQSSTSAISFTADSVADTFTSFDMPFTNGTRVRIINSNIQIGGLPVNESTSYYVVEKNLDVFKLSLNIEGTQLVDVTTSGSGTLNSYVPAQDDESPINEGTSLWLLLRHRPVGANIAVRFRQQPGTLLLQKKITSVEEVRVWKWDNVVKDPGSSYFDTHIDVTNPLRQRPGFAGTTVAMMLV